MASKQPSIRQNEMTDYAVALQKDAARETKD